jgi:AraC-like DNA-binding protein
MPACEPCSRADERIGRLAGARGQPRYLHMLFAEDDTTFGRHLLDHRLDLAHTRLRDPRWSTRTISAIAHDSGFGDLSYFTRTFRRRFAITPY